MNKKLYRNESDKVIGGVSSGLAEYLDVDVTVIRIVFLLLFFFGGSGLLIYIIMWIAVPGKKKYYNVNADYRVYEEPPSTLDPSFSYEEKPARSGGRYWVGLSLVALGLCFLFYEFNLVPYWFNFGRLWPVFIILLGIWVITRSKRDRVTYTSTQADASSDIKTNPTSSASETNASATKETDPDQSINDKL